MKWEMMISSRYLFKKRKEGFISVTTFISILGIAVGVAALIVTMGVMNGFNSEIEEKILDVNPHIIILTDSDASDTDSLAKAVSSIEGVVGTSEFLDGQALVNAGEKTMGVLIRGLYASPRKRLIKIENYLKKGSLGLKGRGAIIGSELADNFKLNVGDVMPVYSPLSGHSRDFTVKGIFSCGRYDYDLNLVFINIDEASALLGKNKGARSIGLKVKDAFNVEDIKQRLAPFIRPPHWILTWKDIDKNLFSALRLEKAVMFILVALIVLVACFNIISTLIMTVMEKTKDIGILKTIGANRAGVMSVFLLEGLYIGSMGIVLGAASGIGLCWLQLKYAFIKLPADVYYISSVPIQIRMPDIIAIVSSAFVLGVLAAIYPSAHASRLSPVDALRYE